MNPCFCYLLPTLAAVACAAESEPLVKLRAHSIECSYSAQEGAEPCCTVRLHARVAPGAALVPPRIAPPFASPLVGMDAAGRVLIGVFRGAEACLENCRTLVYEFYTRPQGGWVEFNTHVDVHVSTGQTCLTALPFDPRRASAFQCGGLRFVATPLPTPEDEPDAHSLFFRLEYKASPTIHSILFCDAEGNMCPNRVLDGGYSERKGLTCATYLLSLKGQTAHMKLVLHNSPILYRVPVRFRAYMGILTDPAIGP